MINVEDYLLLREMSALHARSSVELQSMENELTRLKSRELQKEARVKELAETMAQCHLTEDRLTTIDRELTQHLSPERQSLLEEEGFKLLSILDELREKIQDDRQFLQGFEKTLAEIRAEVETQANFHRRESEMALAHAQEIAHKLPSGWPEAYERIAKRQPPHGPFSRIQGFKCAFCHYTVSRPLESEVESQLLLRACPSCGRLFLPHKAVAG